MGRIHPMVSDPKARATLPQTSQLETLGKAYL
jgi:hypothetical protein